MLVRFKDGYAFVHSRDKAALARSADSHASPAAKEIRIVGNDAFVGRILEGALETRSPQRWTRSSRKHARDFALQKPELCSRIRRRQLVIARAWIAQQCLAGRICSIANVACRLNRDESTIRHALANRALSS
jgi:hypothetical protein